MPSRSDLIDALQELVELLTLAEGGRSGFRARAFTSAAKAVADVAQPASMSAAQLRTVSGIGKSTAETISEFFRTGKIQRLEDLRRDYPAQLVELTRIPGLGAKTVLRLRDEAGVKTVAGLRAAIAECRVATLPGMAAWTEERLTTALEHIGDKHDRRPIHLVLPVAERIRNELSQLPEALEAHLGGSLRRLRSTIADIDVLVISEQPASVLAYFLDMPRVTNVIVRGDHMVSAYIEDGMQVDLRVAPPQERGPALLHFSSGRNHNIRLRMRAHDLGYSLNERSLHLRGKDDVISQGSEEELYALLKLPWIAHGLRQGTGEIEAAEQGRLPTLLEHNRVRGDLHLAATTPQGRSEMIQAARTRSYEYLAFVSVTGDEKAKNKEQEHIVDLRQRHPELLILHACLRDIDDQGDMDYSEDDRASFDLCIASVGEAYALTETEQTDRLIQAIEDPGVRMLAQLTTRRIGEFRGIEFDANAVLEAARENDVAIEITSDLKRLDPPSGLIRRGYEQGNLFVVSSCATDAAGMAAMQYGIRHSHRGWLDVSQIINAWPRTRLEDWLRDPYG